MNNGSKLYELDDQENIALNTPVDIEKETIHARGNNESYMPNDGENVLNSYELKLRENILCCHFEIEEEAFMVVLHDEAEPKIIHETSTYLDSEKWFTTMDDEMESIRKNHVWDLVNFIHGVTLLGINGF